ncbi:heavy-metal-associated domain-containing protein [Odoribacter sp. OttesenSCG-928-G04]|nr:heavy-metal-associated domain-containing protein [Odoribacter sp. OttesenSCG-928-G04]MDL2331303.1 heavy-metal-associated domain-containing protein [Odoribacter sp. OttesenSCG-928-A06]
MRLFLFVLALMGAVSVANAQKANKTIVFETDMDCPSCKAKLEKNLPYEKGVKDLKVDLPTKTVTVTFREDKNSAEDLKKAIEKQNVKVASYKEMTADEMKQPKGKCPKAEGECKGHDHGHDHGNHHGHGHDHH